jgi:hypothetical protein
VTPAAGTGTCWSGLVLDSVKAVGTGMVKAVGTGMVKAVGTGMVKAVGMGMSSVGSQAR